MNFMNNIDNIIPMVQEEKNNRFLNYDIYSRLLSDRQIFMLGPVNDNMANNIVAQLLYLQHKDKKKPITIIINSPGGSVTAGLSIYDTMNSISNEVNTVCIGQACSMGAFILAAGDNRSAQPSARIMIHQPSGGFSGQSTDFQIHAKEIGTIKHYLNSVMAHNCGKDVSEIEKDTERDNFLSAYESLAYGLIDEVSIADTNSKKRGHNVPFEKFTHGS